MTPLARPCTSTWWGPGDLWTLLRYWWTRIAACGLRLTYHLLGPDFALDLLLYADDLEAMGKGLHSLEHLFPAALCYPFKWAKTRGGFRVEWLGMETEYTR